MAITVLRLLSEMEVTNNGIIALRVNAFVKLSVFANFEFSR